MNCSACGKEIDRYDDALWDPEFPNIALYRKVINRSIVAQYCSAKCGSDTRTETENA